LRDDPQWKELLPHLRALGIEVVFAKTLPAWKEAAEDAGIEYARTRLSFGPSSITQDTLQAAMFPTVAKWVRRGGWIEIGEQERIGFTVRALDCGGIVFEAIEARTLDEAMVVLEEGIATYVQEHGVNLG
jgi:hypothetical protein